MAIDVGDPGVVKLVAKLRFADGREEHVELDLDELITSVCSAVNKVSVEIAGKIAQHTVNESKLVTFREVGRDEQGRIATITDVTTRRAG